MNIEIEALPPVTVLSGDDVLIVNKADSYTAKISVANFKKHIFDEIKNDIFYYGDEQTIGLTSDHKFYVKPGSITIDKLSSDVQDTITIGTNVTSNTIGVGRLSAFSTPVTATGDFLILSLSGSDGVFRYRAVRLWDF